MLSVSDFIKVFSIVATRRKDRIASAKILTEYVDEIAADCDELVEKWNQLFTTWHPETEFHGTLPNKFGPYPALRAAYDRIHIALSRDRRLADDLHKRVSEILVERQLLVETVQGNSKKTSDEMRAMVTPRLEALAKHAAEIRHIAKELTLGEL